MNDINFITIIIIAMAIFVIGYLWLNLWSLFKGGEL